MQVDPYNVISLSFVGVQRNITVQELENKKHQTTGKVAQSLKKSLGKELLFRF